MTMIREVAAAEWPALGRFVRAGLVGFVLCGALGTAYAEGGQAMDEATIAVSGSAAVEMAPDQAALRFGVEVQRETAARALDANNELMNAVVKAVRALGVDDSEISTARLTINPVYERRPEPAGGNHSQVLTGYRVANALDVRTESGDRVAAIIDAAVDAGANRVERVSFGLSGRARGEVQESLIAAAVDNARERAEHALGALKYHISGVKSVSLAERPPQAPVFMETARMEMAAAAPPVFAGEQEVRMTVHVTFLIGPD